MVFQIVECLGSVRFVCIAVFFLLLFFVGRLETLFGNDAVFKGNGVTAFPVKTADIQMITNAVTIKHSSGLGWLVEVVTIFKNFGPDAIVQVGFPLEEFTNPDTEDAESEREYPSTPLPDFKILS